jgi:hypothetical protein
MIALCPFYDGLSIVFYFNVLTKEMIMNVCFIPHSTMAQWLISHTDKVLTQLCELTGAKSATYVKDELWFVRLIEPRLSVTRIRDEFANGFAKTPIWKEATND